MVSRPDMADHRKRSEPYTDSDVARLLTEAGEAMWPTTWKDDALAQVESGVNPVRLPVDGGVEVAGTADTEVDTETVGGSGPAVTRLLPSRVSLTRRRRFEPALLARAAAILVVLAGTAVAISRVAGTNNDETFVASDSGVTTTSASVEPSPQRSSTSTDPSKTSATPVEADTAPSNGSSASTATTIGGSGSATASETTGGSTEPTVTSAGTETTASTAPTTSETTSTQISSSTPDSTISVPIPTNQTLTCTTDNSEESVFQFWSRTGGDFGDGTNVFNCDEVRLFWPPNGSDPPFAGQVYRLRFERCFVHDGEILVDIGSDGVIDHRVAATNQDGLCERTPNFMANAAGQAEVTLIAVDPAGRPVPRNFTYWVAAEAP